MAADIIGKPRQSHWLRYIAATDDKEQSEILNARGHPLLAEQDNISYASDCNACHAKGIAMAETVSQVCCRHTEDRRHDIDWNTASLCFLSMVTEFLDNGRYEELGR